MKKLLLVVLTMMAFATQSYANESQCVPTKTVEEAKAQFDAGVAAINEKLQADYAKAMTEYDQATSDLVAHYYATLSAIDTKFSADKKEIQNSHRPGWQKELEVLTAKRNADVKLNYDQYYINADGNVQIYYQKVAVAQDEFRRNATIITDEYNTSVCAQP